MPPVFSAKVKAPFAVLGIRTAGGVVTRIQYLPKTERASAPVDAAAELAVRQIERYLADPQFRFSLPLAQGGTPFRQRAWQAISGIPVGQSRTYGELARLLHTAPRAVGGACAANTIALVVPCHRVVASHGSLGGFMSAKGRSRARISPEARSAEGSPVSAKGRPERELLPLGGTARSAKRAVIDQVDGDPLAVKRWLLRHEGYRFGR